MTMTELLFVKSLIPISIYNILQKVTLESNGDLCISKIGLGVFRDKLVVCHTSTLYFQLLTLAQMHAMMISWIHFPCFQYPKSFRHLISKGWLLLKMMNI